MDARVLLSWASCRRRSSRGVRRGSTQSPGPGWPRRLPRIRSARSPARLSRTRQRTSGGERGRRARIAPGKRKPTSTLYYYDVGRREGWREFPWWPACAHHPYLAARWSYIKPNRGPRTPEENQPPSGTRPSSRGNLKLYLPTER